jgi:FixJ family two-component response regulator
MFAGFMVMNGDTNKTLAEYLDISETSVSNKRTGKTEFTQGQIVAIKNRWNLSAEQVDQIFFAK